MLSPLLFVMVMEALSRRCRDGLPDELLYADDLIVVAKTRELLKERLVAWRKGLEAKGLRVNIAKTKVMRCRVGDGLVKAGGKDPCGVCRKGVGINSIQCVGCQKWVHKKCSGIKGRLKQDPQFKCARCMEGRLAGREEESQEKIDIDIGQGDTVEGVSEFCYLGDVIGAGGGAREASMARVRCAWAKFSELGGILKKRGASLRVKGNLFRTCVQKAMIYGSETWAMKEEDMKRLERAEMSMVRWMSGVSLKQRKTNDELRKRMGIRGVRELVEIGRLRWYGHVERMEEGNMVSECRWIKVEGKKRLGRPCMTWREGVERTMGRRGLRREMARDREVWRNGIHGKCLTLAGKEKVT